MRGTYVSRQGVRVGGWVVWGASLAAGAGMAFASITTGQDCSQQAALGTCTPTSSIDDGLLVGGIAVMLAGSVAGLIMVWQHDVSTIELVPMNTSARSPSLTGREAAWLAPATAGAQGLGVRVRF